MIYILPQQDILKQLFLQLSSHFLLTEEEENALSAHVCTSLEKREINFGASGSKSFNIVTSQGKQALFNPYHSVQYMIFLYYLSHELYINCQIPFLCDKIYYLNKILHSVDLFYAIKLPALWGAEHPLGAVMGRAKYSDGFFFIQGCTVGGTDKEGNIHYPELEENVHMFANSGILGKCHIGKNVSIGAGAIVKNEDVPDNCTVFGESPHLIIKSGK